MEQGPFLPGRIGRKINHTSTDEGTISEKEKKNPGTLEVEISWLPDVDHWAPMNYWQRKSIQTAFNPRGV